MDGINHQHVGGKHDIALPTTWICWRWACLFPQWKIQYYLGNRFKSIKAEYVFFLLWFLEQIQDKYIYVSTTSTTSLACIAPFNRPLLCYHFPTSVAPATSAPAAPGSPQAPRCCWPSMALRRRPRSGSSGGGGETGHAWRKVGKSWISWGVQKPAALKTMGSGSKTAYSWMIWGDPCVSGNFHFTGNQAMGI